jgi:hypothetical protein
MKTPEFTDTEMRALWHRSSISQTKRVRVGDANQSYDEQVYEMVQGVRLGMLAPTPKRVEWMKRIKDSLRSNT